MAPQKKIASAADLLNQVQAVEDEATLTFEELAEKLRLKAEAELQERLKRLQAEAEEKARQIKSAGNTNAFQKIKATWNTVKTNIDEATKQENHLIQKINKLKADLQDAQSELKAVSENRKALESLKANLDAKVEAMILERQQNPTDGISRMVKEQREESMAEAWEENPNESLVLEHVVDAA